MFPKRDIISLFYSDKAFNRGYFQAFDIRFFATLICANFLCVFAKSTRNNLVMKFSLIFVLTFVYFFLVLCRMMNAILQVGEKSLCWEMVTGCVFFAFAEYMCYDK